MSGQTGPNSVSAVLQAPGSVMSAGAGFHADQTCRQVREVQNQLVAPDLRLQDGLAVCVDAVDLDYVLRETMPSVVTLMTGPPTGEWWL